MAVIRKKPSESWNNYDDRLKVHHNYRKVVGINNRTEFDSLEMYKKFLENNKIPYVEGEIEKENGKIVHWIFPQCNFKTLSKTDINKLFKIR